MRLGRFGSGSILRRRRDNVHVDAAVVRLGVAAGDELQELIARQDPPCALGEGPQQTELARRERDMLARRIGEGVAGEVETIAGEFKRWHHSFPFALRRQRFRDARKQAGLVRDVQDVRRGCALPARRDDENAADRGPQLRDRFGLPSR